MIFKDKKTAKALSSVEIGQPIGELESVLSHGDKGHLTFPLPSSITTSLIEDSRVGLVPERHVPQTGVFGIVDAVRNQILGWSLKLEKEGVLGTDVEFSQEEKEKAKVDSNINIVNFKGILGNVQTENLQIGDYASIYDKLKEKEIPQSDRNELECIFDDLKTADNSDRKSVIARGLAWVNKHKEILGSLAQVIISKLGS